MTTEKSNHTNGTCVFELQENHEVVKTEPGSNRLTIANDFLTQINVSEPSANGDERFKQYGTSFVRDLCDIRIVQDGQSTNAGVLGYNEYQLLPELKPPVNYIARSYGPPVNRSVISSMRDISISDELLERCFDLFSPDNVSEQNLLYRFNIWDWNPTKSLSAQSEFLIERIDGLKSALAKEISNSEPDLAIHGFIVLTNPAIANLLLPSIKAATVLSSQMANKIMVFPLISVMYIEESKPFTLVVDSKDPYHNYSLGSNFQIGMMLDLQHSKTK